MKKVGVTIFKCKQKHLNNFTESEGNFIKNGKFFEQKKIKLMLIGNDVFDNTHHVQVLQSQKDFLNMACKDYPTPVLKTLVVILSLIYRMSIVTFPDCSLLKPDRDKIRSP